MVYPVKKWMKADILAYLNANGIPIPKSDGSNASGVDLSSVAILWLHDNHPHDFERLCAWFPFARAVVYRRAYFGVGGRK
jgi:3'-phosphoadenosine 5'-phosphosulfate sulfotransferase (PAPS reductase)/FAD synthetase